MGTLTDTNLNEERLTVAVGDVNELSCLELQLTNQALTSTQHERDHNKEFPELCLLYLDGLNYTDFSLKRTGALYIMQYGWSNFCIRP